MENLNWLDKDEYPFKIHHAMIDGYRMNYIDEGDGETILFIHGTPSWSFEYRNLIKKLKSKYRCIAPDHLGFGLSDKPLGINYRPPAHAARLKKFIHHLNLKNIHLVVHDFGGPIGIAAAIEFPQKIKSLTVINSWLWALDTYPHFTRPAKLIESSLGKFLYEKLNFSVNILLKSGFYNKKLLTEKLHNQYKIPQDKSGRFAAYQLALSLIGESKWYNQLWNNKEKTHHVPMKIIWGMNDNLLPADLLLNKWKEGFPHANIHEIQNSGHFPHEEKPDEVIGLL